MMKCGRQGVGTLVEHIVGRGLEHDVLVDRASGHQAAPQASAPQARVLTMPWKFGQK